MCANGALDVVFPGPDAAGGQKALGQSLDEGLGVLGVGQADGAGEDRHDLRLLLAQVHLKVAVTVKNPAIPAMSATFQRSSPSIPEERASRIATAAAMMVRVMMPTATMRLTLQGGHQRADGQRDFGRGVRERGVWRHGVCGHGTAPVGQGDRGRWAGWPFQVPVRL